MGKSLSIFIAEFIAINGWWCLYTFDLPVKESPAILVPCAATGWLLFALAQWIFDNWD